MIEEIKAVIARTSATIWADLAGGAALMVLLIGVLHFPGAV